MRKALAYFFQFIFGLSPFRNTFYGFYNRLFKPFHLFKNVVIPYVFHQDIRLELRLNDWIQANLFFLGIYENKELLFLEKTLKPKDTFVDIGGHIGLFSLLASKLVESKGKVVTFEPTTLNREQLAKHKNLNNYTNITIEPHAISDKNKQITLYLDSSEQNSGMSSAYATTYDCSETMQAVSLDGYFASNSMDEVHLIKMDVEGSEYDAIIGMKNVLEKYKPTLLIEINPSSPNGLESIEQIISPFGYKTYYLNDAGETIPQRMLSDKSTNFVFKA